MTSFKRKLTTVLLALTAAVCLTFGLLFTVGATPSAEAPVTIDEGYLNIADGTFKGLKNKSETETLNNLLGSADSFKFTVPAGVTKIEDRTSTTSLWGNFKSKIVEADLSGVTEIGAFAFSGCSALRTVTLGTNVTKIGLNAFSNCAALENVTLPASLTSIGAFAFSNCKSFTAITVPVNVASIGVSAFNGCTSATTVNYYAKNASVANNLSPFASGASDVVANIGNGTDEIKSLPAGLFSGTNVTSALIRKLDLNETNVVQSLFYKCTVLKSVSFKDSSVHEIGEGTFGNCESLYKLELPSVTGSVNNDAFSGCARLIDVYNPSNVNIPGVSSNSGINVYTPTEGSSKLTTSGEYVLYNGNALVDYTGVSETVDLTGTAIVEIKTRAFANNTVLKTVKLPDVSVIPEKAFYNCTALTAITLPASVTSVQQQAFANCSKLETLGFGGEKLNDIGNNAFDGCKALKVVKFPASLSTLGAEAFKNCISLSVVYMPDARVGIYDNLNTFSGCANLIVVAPTKNAYELYKKNNFATGAGCTLTYEVTLNLHSVGIDGTENSNAVKLFGMNYGYEKDENGIWTDKNRMPLQDGYSKSVWYKETGLTTKVDETELNSMLADSANSAPIDLYAKLLTIDLSRAELTNAGGSLEYAEISSYTLDATNLNNWYSELPSDLFDNFAVTVSQYSTYRTHVVKPVDNKNSLTDAGAYVLTVNIADTDKYGEWAEGVNLPDITVAPQIVSLGSGGRFTWTTADGKSLLPEETSEQLYIYNNVPYTVKKEGEEPEETVTVKASYLMYSNGSTYTVKLSNVPEKVFVNEPVYVNNSGTGTGSFNARATVTVNNNYTIVVAADSAGEGLSVSNTGDVFTLSKDWYIATTSGNALINSNGGKYSIEGWTYGTAGADPVAPIPQVGSEKNDDGIYIINVKMSFVLTMKINDGSKDISYSTEFKDYDKFNSVINRSMPAAEYQLTVHVGEADGVPPMSATYGFTVEKGDPNQLFPNGADIELFKKTLTSKYNNGANVALLGDTRVEILQLSAEKAHPARVGAWNRDNDYDGFEFTEVGGTAKLDIEQFYQKFQIEFDITGNGSYHTEAYYNSNEDGVQGLRDFGTYPIYYNIYAPSYQSTSELFGQRRGYTLIIGNTINRPNIAVSYTGSSLKDQIARLLASDFYNVIFIDTPSAQATYSNIPGLGITGMANYTDAGSSFVVLQIKTIYQSSCSWSSSFTAISENKMLVRYDFAIQQGVNSVLQGLSIRSWNYGELTSQNKDSYAPVWRPLFGSLYSYTLVAKGYENDSTAERYFYGPDNLNQSNYAGFEEAPAGTYWLIPTVEGDGHNYARWTPSDRSLWAEVVIGKVEKITWVSAPYIESWRYEDDASFALPEGVLPEYLADLHYTTYFCLKSDFDEGLVKTDATRRYESIEKMLEALKLDYLPAGSYAYVYSFEEGENNKADDYAVYFNVIQSRNYWDIAPVIQGWAYGEFTALNVQYAPHFGKATQVAFQYRYIDENGVKYSPKTKIEDYLDGNGQLPVGTYEYQATLRATDDYSELRLTYDDAWMSFKVEKTANSWEDIPNIVGWSEGRFNRDNNAPVAKAKFGNIYYTILDADGNDVVSSVSASDLSASTLNNLDVGNYTLIATVAGTTDYEALRAEAHFAVFEDSVGLTGMIAATLVFAVIAIGLAVCAAVLLIRRNKKIEEEFRKMVNAELRRK